MNDGQPTISLQTFKDALTPGRLLVIKRPFALAKVEGIRDADGGVLLFCTPIESGASQVAGGSFLFTVSTPWPVCLSALNVAPLSLVGFDQLSAYFVAYLRWRQRLLDFSSVCHELYRGLACPLDASTMSHHGPCVMDLAAFWALHPTISLPARHTTSELWTTVRGFRSGPHDGCTFLVEGFAASPVISADVHHFPLRTATAIQSLIRGSSPRHPTRIRVCARSGCGKMGSLRGLAQSCERALVQVDLQSMERRDIPSLVGLLLRWEAVALVNEREMPDGWWLHPPMRTFLATCPCTIVVADAISPPRHAVNTLIENHFNISGLAPRECYDEWRGELYTFDVHVDEWLIQCLSLLRFHRKEIREAVAAAQQLKGEMEPTAALCLLCYVGWVLRQDLRVLQDR